MTNIEALALDICRMKHRDKIMQTLPLILSARYEMEQDGAEKKQESEDERI